MNIPLPDRQTSRSASKPKHALPRRRFHIVTREAKRFNGVRRGLRAGCYVLLDKDAEVYEMRLYLGVDQKSRVQYTIWV